MPERALLVLILPRLSDKSNMRAPDLERVLKRRINLQAPMTMAQYSGAQIRYLIVTSTVSATSVQCSLPRKPIVIDANGVWMDAEEALPCVAMPLEQLGLSGASHTDA